MRLLLSFSMTSAQLYPLGSRYWTNLSTFILWCHLRCLWLSTCWCMASNDSSSAFVTHTQSALRVTKENFTHTSSILALLELPLWLFSEVVITKDFSQSSDKKASCCPNLELSSTWCLPDSGTLKEDGPLLVTRWISIWLYLVKLRELSSGRLNVCNKLQALEQI